MGLHADIKPFLLEEHRSPPEQTRTCRILTDDAMFNLHRFPASSRSTGKDLIAFIADPIHRYLLFPDSLVYILTFDSSFPLLAKAQTRQARASRAPSLTLETDVISDSELPHPFVAAITSPSHKYKLIDYLVNYFLQQVGSKFVPEGKRLYIHASHRAHVITSSSVKDLGPQSPSLAEGDVASFFWLRVLAPDILANEPQPKRTCFMRTLDSDSICVGLLAQEVLLDVVDLHLWLVKRGGEVYQPLCTISDCERADCLNVNRLVRALRARHIVTTNFVALLAAMGTDFTPKLFPGVGVKVIIEHGTNLLQNRTAFTCANEIEAFFTELATNLPRKKTPSVCKSQESVLLVCTQILWTIKYWNQEDPDPRAYGWN